MQKKIAIRVNENRPYRLLDSHTEEIKNDLKAYP